jgi:hypothetical protein
VGALTGQVQALLTQDVPPVHVVQPVPQYMLFDVASTHIPAHIVGAEGGHAQLPAVQTVPPRHEVEQLPQ